MSTGASTSSTSGNSHPAEGTLTANLRLVLTGTFFEPDPSLALYAGPGDGSLSIGDFTSGQLAMDFPAAFPASHLDVTSVIQQLIVDAEPFAAFSVRPNPASSASQGAWLYSSNEIADVYGFEPVTLEVACTYDFDGFYQPVDNATWNRAKAGSTIPVKFSLGGDIGLNILKSGYPEAIPTTCPGGSTPTDRIEETATAGGSSLTYDAYAAVYIYVWETSKVWAGRCYTFELGLDDDTSHMFAVQFVK